MQNLNDIITACQHKDRNAQKELYLQFSSVVRKLCLFYSHNQEDAKDLMQNIFIKIFDKIGDFKFDGSFEGWVKRLSVNYCLNYLKQNKSKDYNFVNIESINEQSIINNEIDEDFELKNDLSKDDIMEAVNKLPADYKEVFYMYVFEDLSHNEIAKTLGISYSNSRVKLSRARMFLKEILVKNNKINGE